MTKGLARSIGRGTPQQAPIVKETYNIVNRAIAVVGATGVGFAGVSVGGLPQGNILLLGAVAYLQVSSPSGDVDVFATWTGAYSIGTAITADSTLAGSEVDIIPQTTIAAATARLSPVTRGVSAGATAGVILDNTDTTLNLNCNLLIDDASISGTADMVLNGFVQLAYIVLGDD
jgi:hypothetical protein